MMVCMKMLPEWRREEQSFVRSRLKKNFSEDTTESSPEDEDGPSTGVVNAAEKT